MKQAVLIASYKRPADLARCLQGLEGQTRAPDEVVVVLRQEDHPSWELLREFTNKSCLPLRAVPVERPGVLAANNAALPTLEADLVSFIDDDACPAPDWLARIEDHFRQRPQLGALGGRDRFAHPLMREETERETRTVGQIRWYGKIINYHHRRFAGVTKADSLKGCNMSFRRELLGLCDEGLGGNACYYELDLCFRVKKRGFDILFDGDLLVDHYLSDNHLDRFRRGERHPERVYQDYYNRARVLLRHLRGWRWATAAAYWLLVEPNVALLRFVREKFPEPLSCWREALRGSWRGFASLRNDFIKEGLVAPLSGSPKKTD